MRHTPSGAAGPAERRSAERFPCPPDTNCVVTDILDQSQLRAGAWDISEGGTCLLLDAQYPPGTRFIAHLCPGRHAGADDDEALLLWLKVEHSDICCPGARDFYITGCSFVGEVYADDLQPFMSREGRAPPDAA